MAMSEPAARTAILPGRPLRQKAEADTGEMKQARGNHKAERIGDSIGAFRQFGAMRMAVEDREDADEDRGDPQIGFCGQRHHQAEHDRRHRDPDLDAGQGNAENAEHAAHSHHQRKHHRQDQHRRHAEKRAPQSYRQHRRDMIGAEQRMRESAGKASGQSATGMGQSGRCDRETKSGDRDASHAHAALRAAATLAPRRRSISAIGSEGSMSPRQAMCWSGRTSASLCG